VFYQDIYNSQNTMEANW